jgi:hypothetical protein
MWRSAMKRMDEYSTNGGFFQVKKYFLSGSLPEAGIVLDSVKYA